MTWCPHCSSAHPVKTDYSSRRDPDLPWGYWLREGGHGADLFDEDGRRWGSVRQAFWFGRLSMAEGPKSEHGYGNAAIELRAIGAQLELMIAVMHVLVRNFISQKMELANDVLGASTIVSGHYMEWLMGHGLITHRPPVNDTYVLTDEGRAVLTMLKVTRPEELIDVQPGSEAMTIAGGPDFAHIANPEIDLAGVRFVFERSTLARRAVIALVDREGMRGRMPMQQTVWSCAFSTPLERDRLFEWMCGRADRWQDWGAIANRNADGLTQHLLDIYISSVDWHEPQVGPQLALAHG